MVSRQATMQRAPMSSLRDPKEATTAAEAAAGAGAKAAAEEEEGGGRRSRASHVHAFRGAKQNGPMLLAPRDKRTGAQEEHEAGQTRD